MMEPPAAPRSTNGATVGRVPLVVGTGVAVAGTFLIHFLTATFTNDHFVHLSRAQQVLYGDVPLRDFFDPGLPLLYYVSAGALLLSGHNLLGELILSAAGIAAGTGLTFVAAARLSRSFWLALVAAGVAAMTMPRLYNYPKAFFYALALVVGWRYACRPASGALIGLGVVTAAAFHFRQDHGVYIGLAVLVLLAIRHWERRGQIVTSLAQYGATVLLLLVPFLVFVQTTTGLGQYVGDASLQAQGLAAVRFNWLPVSVDLTAPLLVVLPPAGPRVYVRWVDGLDAAARQDLEQRHELVNPQHVEDTTWSYVPAHLDKAHIGALVADPAVADTHGIDRAGGVVEADLPLYLALQRRFPVLRIQVAPGVLTAGNALAWFYYVTFLLPLVGLVLVVILLWRGEIDRPEAASAGMAAVLGLIIVQMLVRGSADSRLVDVANPIAVIGAWVGARCLRFSAGRIRLVRHAPVAILVLLVAITAWSVGVTAEVKSSLETSRLLSGPVGVWRRAETVIERLRSRPIDALTGETVGLGGLMRYVFECTAATDRLFVTWFAPEVFFVTERAFAGGQVYLTAGWYASPADQRVTVERLERQRVPIVLENVEWDYQQYFPIVAEYIRHRFTEAPIRSETMRGYRVLVDSRVTPTGTYEPLGTPCYR